MARVLVIDDNQDMRELMQVILEGAGHAVELAADGEAGLRAQSLRPVDVVITDIFMPNQDGIETISRLREEYPMVKVVAVSGGSASGMKSGSYLFTAREIGAHVVLSKPFEHDELVRIVREVMQ